VKRTEEVPRSWRRALAHATADPAFASTLDRIRQARLEHDVYPSADRIFAALELTAPESVRVVILGQDPYPTPGHANGLAFSVSPGVKIPGSLRNILRSLRDDLEYEPPASGSLEPWARQGVLLLNTILTVERGHAGSHRPFGWQTFTDTVIRSVNGSRTPVVFLLWGKQAQAKADLITGHHHIKLATSHPSPLSANRGFLSDRPLIRANEALRTLGHKEVDWHLPPA
jgi:uracil-DNA glycosylase